MSQQIEIQLLRENNLINEQQSQSAIKINFQ